MKGGKYGVTAQDLLHVKLWGRFERHRSIAKVRREDDGTVPLLHMPEQSYNTGLAVAGSI